MSNKQPYSPPQLEAQPQQYLTLTGVSLPISTTSFFDDLEETLGGEE
ncbi:MAG: hypothetical protein HC933_06745 [Pleurocapsa sp. SU_196_0]|nr:hypothetical protein [Pleurocapsa sp. SU_196_0]